LEEYQDWSKSWYIHHISWELKYAAID
jgi:hypothetical protein